MSQEPFPRRFGRYTLIDHLAQGGMGSLYLAYQGEPGMEKLCVVKTVLRELADKEYVARFRDEAKVVVRLSHGNLVPVFDAGSAEGELYIAMDHVDGKDLRAVWNKCAEKAMPFPVDVAVYIIKELCRGLHHAHTFRDLKLVHRDVSPPNVLLGYSGEIKLTDFGLANSSLKLQYTMPGIIYGKVSYMSPEQARGDSLDGRADVYAAGVILWELLTGRQLFPNTDGTAIERVRSPEVTRPSLKASRVPLALDPLVMKALSPDPDQRFQDAEALRAALAGYLAKEAPTIDTARVAGFLRQLFGDEIERERERRDLLVADSRVRLARSTLEPQGSRVAPPPTGMAASLPPRPMVAPSPSKPPRPPELLVLESGPVAPPPPVEPLATVEIDPELERSAGLVDTILDGRYRVMRLIGEGGMGRVYEAEHIDIGKRVAIKVLHPVWSRFPELVARFRREARAASRIGHPNIIDVTDSGSTPAGGVYIVMEYLEGADLAEVIHREKALEVHRAVGIACQLARALEAAHNAGVVHRDLKPENVFLVARPGQADFVKVLDFGIALNTEVDPTRPRLTLPNMAMGTPQYMSPEQAAGKPADARSDIYGVGVIVYEMLVGRPPHVGKNNEEILHKKLTEVPVPVADLRTDVQASLSDCIAAALARDPANRQQRMAELADELERCRPDRRRRGERPELRTEAIPELSRSSPMAASRRNSARQSQAVPVAAPTPRWVQRTAIGGAALLLASSVGALLLRQSGGPAGPLPAAQLGAERPLASPYEEALPRPAARPARAAEPAAAPAVAPTPPAPVTPASATGTAAPARTAARVDAPGAPGAHDKVDSTAAATSKRALDEANRLLRDHQLAQAERAYQKLADAGVEKVAAYTGLARVAFEGGHYGDAVKRGERAVRHGGGLPAHRVLADAYYRTGKYSLAVKEYRAVLKLKPDDNDARRHLEAAVARSGG